MKIYNAYYSKNGLFVSLLQFKANNLKEAKRFAKIHKQMSQKIKKAGRVKTEINLIHI
jgi:hypothetical protein